MTAENTRRPAARAAQPDGAGNARKPAGQVSDALRNAYEEAVREEVPAEFLDLLGKLS